MSARLCWPDAARPGLAKPNVVGRGMLVLAVLALLAACVPQTRVSVPAAGTAPDPRAASEATLDASYDWHGLVIVPFGMLLKESPFALHEVLLFHDDTQPGEADNKDCYATGQAPRFLGRQPDEYLLCFTHDHLSRIEAAVDLPAAQAAPTFAQACALWLKAAARPPAGDLRCEGRDGRISFMGRLGAGSGDAGLRLSMTLVESPPLP